MFDYSPLWETMKEKNITTYDLIQGGIDKRIINNIRHNKNITVKTLEILCTILDCTPEKIIKFVPQKK